MTLVRSVGSLAVFALLAACSASTEESAASVAQNLSSANTDIQVLRAQSNDLVLDAGGLDRNACVLSDVHRTSENKGEAQADCTTALEDGTHRPAFNVVWEPLVWLNFAPGTEDVTYRSFRHWCAKASVTVAVKAAAWDSPTFEGLGFWSSADLEMPAGKERVFYAKDDPRLVRTGEADLASGEHAYLYELVGRGPCDVNGSGSVPHHTTQFKPFVRYAGGIEQWENVQQNHEIGYHASWDRSGDLLR